MTSNNNAHGMHYVFTTGQGAASESSVISEASSTATLVTCGQNQISLTYPLAGNSGCCFMVFGGDITSID